MSKDWTPKELENASQMMKSAGYPIYEEFCEMMGNGFFAVATAPVGSQRGSKEKQCLIYIGKRKSPHRAARRPHGGGINHYGAGILVITLPAGRGFWAGRTQLPRWSRR